MKPRYVALLAILMAICAIDVAAGETFTGQTLVRVDSQGRLLVVMDEVPADGTADRLWIFESSDPFPPLGPRPVSPTSVTYDRAMGRLIVKGISDGLYLDLLVTQVPGDLEIREDGRDRYFGTGRGILYKPIASTLSVEQVDTDRLEVVSKADSEDPLAIVCGKDGRVKVDTDCSKGGPGSSSVSMSCPGFPGVSGESGSASCGFGHYACGYCWLGVAYAVCRSAYCP
jgi:hypothetical protein